MTSAFVFTYPDPSHVGSTLPLAAELVRRGEDLVVWASENFRAAIERTGARFRAYGPAMGTASNNGPFGGMARRLGFAERVLPELLGSLQEERPRYLLADSAAVWGSIAGHVLEIPRISYRLTFALHPSMIDGEGLVRMFYGAAPAEFVLGGMVDLVHYHEIAQRLDRKYGTRMADMVESLVDRQALNLVMFSRLLQPRAECFDASYRFVGRCLGEPPAGDDFPWGALRPVPMVYIALGTVFNNRPEFFRACMDAFAGLPLQAVMDIGRRTDRAALGTAPENVLVFDHSPQWKLVERAALVICHAGGSSVQECLRAGAPTLLYPQAGDQFTLADRVEEIGAGLRLREEDIRPDRLRELAGRVLNEPGFRDRAAAARESMLREGGTSAAADAILQFASDSHTAGAHA
jgi:MGT family glycosyltransferase